MIKVIEQTYSELGMIESPILREFSEFILCQAKEYFEKEIKLEAGIVRADQPHYAEDLFRQSKTAVYFANKLCGSHFEVKGAEQDAVLAACLLHTIVSKIGVDFVKDAARRFPAIVPNLDIVITCVATLCNGLGFRVFPDEFNDYERIVVLAYFVLTPKKVFSLYDNVVNTLSKAA